MAYITKTKLQEILKGAPDRASQEQIVNELIGRGHKLEGYAAATSPKATTGGDQKTKGVIGKIGSFLGIEKIGRFTGSRLAELLSPEYRRDLEYLREQERAGNVERGTVQELKSSGVSKKEALASTGLLAANLATAGAGKALLGTKATGLAGAGIKAGKAAATGGVFGGLGSAKEGGGVKDVAKGAAVGAAIGGTLSLATSAATALAKKLVTAISGKSESLISKAYANPKEALAGRKDTTLADITRKGRASTKKLSIELGKNHRKGTRAIYEKIGTSRINNSTKKSLLKGATNIMDDFDVLLDGDELSFRNTAISKTAEQKNIKQAYNLFKEWDDITPKGLNTLRQKIGSLTNFDTAKATRKSAIVGKLYNEVNKSIKTNIPELSRLNTQYVGKVNFIKELDTIFKSRKGDVGIQSTIDRLAKLFSKEQNYSRQIVQQLEKKAGIDILGGVAGRGLFSPETSGGGGLTALIRQISSPLVAGVTVVGGGINRFLGTVIPKTGGMTIGGFSPVVREAVMNAIGSGTGAALRR